MTGEPAERPGEPIATTKPESVAPKMASVSSGEQSIQVSAATILASESKVRAAKSETELVNLIANELRKLVAGRQAILLRANRENDFKVVCISSVALNEKDTPFTRWIEGMIRQLISERGAREPVSFELPAFVEKNAPETRAYPFGHFLWQPLILPSGHVYAGMLLSRERSWSEQEQNIVRRECEVFSVIWRALSGERTLQPRSAFGKKKKIALIAGFVAVALCPVPMTTLAPVEIIPLHPQRVTAPIDGVIKEILVDPNRVVKAGQELLRFDSTTLSNRMQLAEQDVFLAKSRYDRLGQASFADDKARHELAQARAELALKEAERDYAADLLARSTITAERDGLLVYSDKDRWIGKPVKTGERIMQIVDAGEVAARIEVPVADAIVLRTGARVRMFLDTDPLGVVAARITSESYQAEPNSTQQLVYRVNAELTEKNSGLRIGARGTAQLMGSYVPLSFYLLRRPISALRQHAGL